MSSRGHKLGKRYPRNCLSDHERTPTYFVPAFGVRRGVSLDDPEVPILLRTLRKKLDKHYSVPPPSKLSLSTIEKNTLIERMREARAKPSSCEMRELALSTRDGLREMIADTPTRLTLPLGQIARLGSQRNILGIVPLGWRGYRAHYAIRDEQDKPLALGTIVAENQFSLGVISAAMATNRRFVIDGLAQTPYIPIARHNGPIQDHELRVVQDKLEDEVPDTLALDDPVIYLSNMVGHHPELIYVRDHSQPVSATSVKV